MRGLETQEGPSATQSASSEPVAALNMSDLLFGPSRNNRTFDMEAITDTMEHRKPYRAKQGDWVLRFKSLSAVSWFASALVGSQTTLAES